MMGSADSDARKVRNEQVEETIDDLDLSYGAVEPPPGWAQDSRLWEYPELVQAAGLPAPRGEPDDPSSEWSHARSYIGIAIHRAARQGEKEAEITWLLEKVGLTDHKDVRELFDLALGLYRLALKDQSPLNAYRAEVVMVDLTNGMIALARQQHLSFAAGHWIPEGDA